MTKRQKLTTLEKNVLICIPYGVDNAINSKELATAVGAGIRATRQAVNSLRYKGYLIGSTKKAHGVYYKINSYTEGVNTLKMLEHQRDQTSKLIAVFRNSLNTSKGSFESVPTYRVTSEQLNLKGMPNNANNFGSRTAKRDSKLNY